jgi:hypothetical protein
LWGAFIFFSFIIYDLYAENEYLISMNLSVCFEPDNCQVVYDIFINVRMPRPTCDWDKSYKMSALNTGDLLKEVQFI